MNEINELPRAEFAFPGPLRDKLVAAILNGDKTTTSSLLEQYERNGDDLPQAGDRSVLVDSDDKEVAVLRTTSVELVPLSEISVEHAQSEGEGFTTVTQWREGHEEFWTSSEFTTAYGEPPIALTENTIVVCETFTVEDLLK